MGLFTSKLSLPCSIWIRVWIYVEVDKRDSSIPWDEYKKVCKIYDILLNQHQGILEKSSYNPNQLYSIRFPNGLLSQVFVICMKRVSKEELKPLRVIRGGSAR